MQTRSKTGSRPERKGAEDAQNLVAGIINLSKECPLPADAIIKLELDENAEDLDDPNYKPDAEPFTKDDDVFSGGKKRPTKRTKKDGEPRYNDYSCASCDFCTHSVKKLWRHIRGKHKKFNCELCPYRTNQESWFKGHLRRHAGKTFQCDACPQLFATLPKLTRHRLVHAPARSFPCPVCPFTTIHVHNLKQHAMIHSDERPFRCGLCGFATRQRRSLALHRARHAGRKPLRCAACPYRTGYPSAMRRHRLTHAAEKPYFHCALCDYRSCVKQKLRAHLERHENRRRHKCARCAYRSNEAYALSCHVRRSHERQDRFFCDECPFAAALKQDIRGHMRVHEKRRPFSCHVCGYRYKLLKGLKWHMSAAHSSCPPLNCGVGSFEYFIEKPTPAENMKDDNLAHLKLKLRRLGFISEYNAPDDGYERIVSDNIGPVLRPALKLRKTYKRISKRIRPPETISNQSSLPNSNGNISAVGNSPGDFNRVTFISDDRPPKHLENIYAESSRKDSSEQTKPIKNNSDKIIHDGIVSNDTVTNGVSSPPKIINPPSDNSVCEIDLKNTSNIELVESCDDEKMVGNSTDADSILARILSDNSPKAKIMRASQKKWVGNITSKNSNRKFNQVGNIPYMISQHKNHFKSAKKNASKMVGTLASKLVRRNSSQLKCTTSKIQPSVNSSGSLKMVGNYLNKDTNISGQLSSMGTILESAGTVGNFADSSNKAVASQPKQIKSTDKITDGASKVGNFSDSADASVSSQIKSIEKMPDRARTVASSPDSSNEGRNVSDQPASRVKQVKSIGNISDSVRMVGNFAEKLNRAGTGYDSVKVNNNLDKLKLLNKKNVVVLEKIHVCEICYAVYRTEEYLNSHKVFFHRL